MFFDNRCIYTRELKWISARIFQTSTEERKQSTKNRKKSLLHPIFFQTSHQPDFLIFLLITDLELEAIFSAGFVSTFLLLRAILAG
jgi:hypothetical protein